MEKLLGEGKADNGIKGRACIRRHEVGISLVSRKRREVQLPSRGRRYLFQQTGG
jgi:hypothetical protein